MQDGVRAGLMSSGPEGQRRGRRCRLGPAARRHHHRGSPSHCGPLRPRPRRHPHPGHRRRAVLGGQIVR